MKKERIFWGILFILAGIFMILSKLEYFPDMNIFSFMLTFVLVVVIVKSVVRLNFPGILFPLAVICIIYNQQLGITSITPWTVLIAALLGSIGLSMIFTKHTKWLHNSHSCEDYKFEKIDVRDESNVRFRNSFCGSAKYINSDKFEQADFNCSFGAMKVYFDNVVMSNENAVVRIDASFSGIELYIPKTWNVENKTNVFFGSVDEKNRNNETTTNNLTLVGDVSFSGVEIIYI